MSHETPKNFRFGDSRESKKIFASTNDEVAKKSLLNFCSFVYGE